MTARSVPEWRGKTPDTAIPLRVRLRVFDAYKGRCASCTRKLTPADKWDCDHITALVNGGEHRERNLQPLCSWCHSDKTKADVKQKSENNRRRAKHLGQHKPRGRSLDQPEMEEAHGRHGCAP